MLRKSLILALAAALLPTGALAGEEPKKDPAAELLNRTYNLALIGQDLVAGGTTYGVALFKRSALAEPKKGQPPRLEAPFAAAALPDSVNSVLAADGRLYAANGPRGVKIFETGGEGTLRLAGEVATPGAALRMALSGNHLFVAMGVSGLGIYDVSELNDIRTLAVHDTGGYARDVMVAQKTGDGGTQNDGDGGTQTDGDGGTQNAGDGGTTIYVANGKGGIVAIGLKQDLSLASTARLELAGDVRRIVPFRDGLLFSLGTKGVCFVAPGLDKARLACTANGDVARDLLVVADTVYVADGGAGLTIMDWTDPAAPRTVRSLAPESGSLNGLLLIGSTIYAAADYYGVYLYEMSDLTGK